MASVPEQSADDEEAGKDEEDEARRAALVQAYGDGLSAGYVGESIYGTENEMYRSNPFPLCTSGFVDTLCFYTIDVRRGSGGKTERGGALSLQSRPSLRCLPLTDIPRPSASPYTMEFGCEDEQCVAHTERSLLSSIALFFLLLTVSR